jgi:PREDICTED: similar to LTG19
MCSVSGSSLLLSSLSVIAYYHFAYHVETIVKYKLLFFDCFLFSFFIPSSCFLALKVEVQLELGHKASPRLKPTDEGYTHDWTVFVKGADSCNIKYFVEKVVFQLHESFPKPKRGTN